MILTKKIILYLTGFITFIVAYSTWELSSFKLIYSLVSFFVLLLLINFIKNKKIEHLKVSLVILMILHSLFYMFINQNGLMESYITCGRGLFGCMGAIALFKFLLYFLPVFILFSLLNFIKRKEYLAFAIVLLFLLIIFTKYLFDGFGTSLINF